MNAHHDAHVSVNKSIVWARVQVYFSGVVVPAVQASVAELSSASSALLSLIRAVEDSITVVLRKCVDAFMTEVSCGVCSAVSSWWNLMFTPSQKGQWKTASWWLLQLCASVWMLEWQR
jgi:hypothetical protein